LAQGPSPAAARSRARAEMERRSASPQQAQQQVEQIRKVYNEWCVKAAEIILESRVETPGLAEARPPPPTTAFSLRVPEFFHVRDEVIARPEFFSLRTQRSFQIEIFLSTAAVESMPGLRATTARAAPGEKAAPPCGAAARTAGAGPSGPSLEPTCEADLLIERWTFTFFPAHPEPMPASDRSNQILVKKLSVTLRSLLCFTRILPAYGVCRGPCAVAGARRWRFRVEAWAPKSTSPAGGGGAAASAPSSSTATAGVEDLVTQEFVSLPSSVGTLRLSVAHRKDLRRPAATGVVESTFGAKFDRIEVEEGYVAGADPPPAPELGILGKIAEEPDAKAHGSLGAVALVVAAGTDSVPGSPNCSANRDGRRERGYSDDSIASTCSASSRGQHSLPDHTVSVGSTPPFASVNFCGPPPGLISLGPQPVGRSESTCSSRSSTAHSTPQLGTAPDPHRVVDHGVSEAQRSNRGSIGSPPHPGSPAVEAANRSSTFAASHEHLRATGSSTASQPGVFDDLSDVFVNYPSEWGRRRRSVSSDRVSCSRSLSPAGSTAEEAEDSLAASSGRRRASGLSDAWDGSTEPVAEIQLCGMSDEDEDDEEAQSSEVEEERNIVASTLAESSAGAFVVSSGCVPPGLACSGDSLEPSPVSPVAARPRMLSPLIAQLNPFGQPPSEEFLLPMGALDAAAAAEARGAPAGAALAVEAVGSGGLGVVVEAGAEGARAASEAAGATSSAEAGKRLLGEMGDLLCKLQQKRELAITSQEVLPDELLVRLAHFQELARSAELQCRA